MQTNILTPLANQITSIAGSIAATGQLISKCSLSEEYQESLLLNISERLKLIQMLTDARPEERIKALKQVEEEIQVIIMQAFTGFKTNHKDKQEQKRMRSHEATI